MKIQITMTTGEAENILSPIMADRSNLGSNDSATVKIVNPESVPTFPPLVEFVALVRKFHPVQEKIASIKAVREHAAAKGFQMGLADAKLFVEAINPYIPYNPDPTQTH